VEDLWVVGEDALVPLRAVAEGLMQLLDLDSAMPVGWWRKRPREARKEILGYVGRVKNGRKNVAGKLFFQFLESVTIKNAKIKPNTVTSDLPRNRKTTDCKV